MEGTGCQLHGETKRQQKPRPAARARPGPVSLRIPSFFLAVTPAAWARPGAGRAGLAIGDKCADAAPDVRAGWLLCGLG